jgi:hypothetical protein
LGNWQLKPIKISQLAFADDLVLLLKSEEDLNNRISLAGRMYFKLNKTFLNNKEVTRKTKLTIQNNI